VIDPELEAVDVHPEHWLRLTRLIDSLFGGGRTIWSEPDRLARALAAAAPRVRADMDPADQARQVLAAALADAGRTPGPLLAAWLHLPFGLLQAAFDRLWPDGTALALYVVDEDLDEVWSSLILRKARGSLELLTTDRCLGADGLDASAWRTDAARARAALARRVAPVHAACFCSREALFAWLEAPPGADPLARLRAAGDVLLEPWPWRVAGAVALGRALVWARRRLRPQDEVEHGSR